MKCLLSISNDLISKISVFLNAVVFCCRRRRLVPVWAVPSAWHTRSSYTRPPRFSWGPLRSRAGRPLHRCSSLQLHFFTAPARGPMMMLQQQFLLRAPPRDHVGWVRHLNYYLIFFFIKNAIFQQWVICCLLYHLLDRVAEALIGYILTCQWFQMLLLSQLILLWVEFIFSVNFASYLFFSWTSETDTIS